MAIDETVTHQRSDEKIECASVGGDPAEEVFAKWLERQADLQAKEKPGPMAMKIVGPPPTSIPGGRVIAAGGKIRLHRPPGEGACLGAN